MSGASSGVRRFGISYLPALRWLFVVFGMGPRVSRVELTDDQLRVRMGWWWVGHAPRSSVRSATRLNRPIWYAIGIHVGWRSTWLVNGSPNGIVLLEFEPRPRMRFAGLPVHPRRLAISLEDPDGFLAAVGARPLDPARTPPTTP